MTSEREKEIRNLLAEYSSFGEMTSCSEALRDCLTTIDALRADVSRIANLRKQDIENLQASQKERDFAKSQLIKYEQRIDCMKSFQEGLMRGCDVTANDRNKLRQRIEKLKDFISDLDAGYNCTPCIENAKRISDMIDQDYEAGKKA